MIQLHIYDLKTVDSPVAIPVEVGEKTKYCFGMLDNAKYLGADDAKGLENFKDKYWGPAENEDYYNYS